MYQPTNSIGDKIAFFIGRCLAWVFMGGCFVTGMVLAAMLWKMFGFGSGE